MLYTCYFFNWTTGEVVAAHRHANTAGNAIATFRRKMRDTGTLQSGQLYNFFLYKGKRDLSDLPPDYMTAPRAVAR